MLLGKLENSKWWIKIDLWQYTLIGKHLKSTLFLFRFQYNKNYGEYMQEITFSSKSWSPLRLINANFDTSSRHIFWNNSMKIKIWYELLAANLARIYLTYFESKLQKSKTTLQWSISSMIRFTLRAFFSSFDFWSNFLRLINRRHNRTRAFSTGFRMEMIWNKCFQWN